MTNYLYKLKIMQKFALIFSLILLAVLVSYGVVFWFSAKQKTQGTQIDVAGRNRMLSQRIGVMALLVDSDNEVQASEAREEMRKAIVLVEQSLDALKNGGIAPGIEGNIILPPAPAIIVPKITEIEEYFKTDKELATLLLNEPRFVVLPAATSDSSAAATAEVINWKFKQSIDN